MLLELAETSLVELAEVPLLFSQPFHLDHFWYPHRQRLHPINLGLAVKLCLNLSFWFELTSKWDVYRLKIRTPLISMAGKRRAFCLFGAFFDL